ncbi:MAG: hypothetical protein JWQ64_3789 [Subtercola sp.]|nr:hypothetical protein [Subtercola sp.]
MIKSRYLLVLPIAFTAATAGVAAALAVPIDAGPARSAGAGTSPGAIALGDGGQFFTANDETNTLSSFAADGGPGSFAPVALGAGATPTALTYTSSGVIYTANFGNHT